MRTRISFPNLHTTQILLAPRLDDGPQRHTHSYFKRAAELEMCDLNQYENKSYVAVFEYGNVNDTFVVVKVLWKSFHVKNVDTTWLCMGLPYTSGEITFCFYISQWLRQSHLGELNMRPLSLILKRRWSALSAGIWTCLNISLLIPDYTVHWPNMLDLLNPPSAVIAVTFMVRFCRRNIWLHDCDLIEPSKKVCVGSQSSRLFLVLPLKLYFSKAERKTVTKRKSSCLHVLHWTMPSKKGTFSM